MKCPRCGLPLRAGFALCPGCLTTDSPDDAVAGLLLEEELGRGGMGIVYRARERESGKLVAVKFLAPELASDAAVRARFEREAHALALLDHPNIVRLERFAEADGEALLVMEHVDGGSVEEKAPFEPAAAVKVMLQVVHALEYAHGKGVIHRDLKPQNVLLTKGGVVKVSDFGIARLLGRDRGQTLTRTGVVVGTVGFMAPEALHGGEPDARVDVYGAGALLRALLTGRAPVGELGALPAGLHRVIRKAMAERPEDRFATMRELGRALEGVLPWLEREGLPPDERLWLRGTSLLLSAAAGVALWALVLSLTPRVQPKGDTLPLVMLGAETLADGSVFTQARFEIGPALAALLSLALAVLAYGMLRRHWRLEGLDAPNPDPPVPEAKTVFALGLAACALFAGRVALERAGVLGVQPGGARAYIPLFGGVLETLALYYFVVAVLEATRRSRPLARERLLLFGMALALFPPLFDLVRTALEASAR